MFLELELGARSFSSSCDTQLSVSFFFSFSFLILLTLTSDIHIFMSPEYLVLVVGVAKLASLVLLDAIGIAHETAHTHTTTKTKLARRARIRIKTKTERQGGLSLRPEALNFHFPLQQITPQLPRREKREKRVPAAGNRQLAIGVIIIGKQQTISFNFGTYTYTITI
jgi:hypothetical protein